VRAGVVVSAARWRGLAALVVDAVDAGSRAIERVQHATAARPFAILERIPPIAPVARVAHVAHDAGVTGVHLVIRAVAQAGGAVVRAGTAPADRDGADRPGSPLA
jgi:hypothetical protein